MGRVHDVLRWANRRAVAEEVTRRGYRVLFTIAPDIEKQPAPQWDGLMAKMDSIAREVATLREETVAARLARLAVADVAGQPPPDGAAASTGPDEPDQAQSEPTAPHGQ